MLLVVIYEQGSNATNKMDDQINGNFFPHTCCEFSLPCITMRLFLCLLNTLLRFHCISSIFGSVLQVLDAKGEKSLALFPAKFQKSMWIKRGSFQISSNQVFVQILEILNLPMDLIFIMCTHQYHICYLLPRIFYCWLILLLIWLTLNVIFSEQSYISFLIFQYHQYIQRTLGKTVNSCLESSGGRGSINFVNILAFICIPVADMI